MSLHLGGHAPHAHFGTANRITLARGMIASLLGGAVPVVTALDAQALWAASAAALLALVLDGVDGWIARRTRMASAYGQHLDINFDTVMMGILALLAWQGGKAGAWVLAIGLARYVFVAAGWIWPWLNARTAVQPAPARHVRRTDRRAAGLPDASHGPAGEQPCGGSGTWPFAFLLRGRYALAVEGRSRQADIIVAWDPGCRTSS